MTDLELRKRVVDYLAARSVATLATTGSAGPWASAVFYASRDLTLYFVSSPDSRHCQNLAYTPRVAAAIHEDISDWRAIVGVQLEGTAAAADADQLAEVVALYGAKFPVVGATAPEVIARALARARWYRVVPDRLYFIDNAAGFGNRREVAL